MALLDAIKVFRSTDAGAPSVIGAAGSLVSFFNAILSDGYNGRSVESIAVAAGIATAKVSGSSAHGYVPGQVVAIGGANESVFNNEFIVTSVPTGMTFTFTAPAGAPASSSGTVTVKQASLNFEKLFTPSSPANWGTWRSTDIRSNKPVLNLDNTYGYWGRVCMYESMTAYNVGINGDHSAVNTTLSSTQKYGVWQSGLAADSAAKQWIAFGNSRTFYVFMKYGAATSLGGEWWGFGEFKSYRQADFYNAFLLATFAQSLNSSPGQQIGSYFQTPGSGTNNGHVALMRTGLCLAPVSGPGNKSGYQMTSGQSTWNSGNIGMTFPSLFGSQIISGPIFLADAVGGYMRGVLPGLLCIYNTIQFDEIVLPSADYPGRTLQCLRYNFNANTFYNLLADLTGPWVMP